EGLRGLDAEAVGGDAAHQEIAAVETHFIRGDGGRDDNALFGGGGGRRNKLPVLVVFESFHDRVRGRGRGRAGELGSTVRAGGEGLGRFCRGLILRGRGAGGGNELAVG